MPRSRTRLALACCGVWVLLGALAGPRATFAASYVTTIQPDYKSTDDSYLREDGASERNGTRPDLRLKASDDLKNKHAIVQIPLTGLAGKTILQGWLQLKQSSGNSPTPIDARIFPLTETWVEPEVSWADRQDSVAWGSPGGTHDAFWTGRALSSSGTIGQVARWQVGPILQGWQLGTVPNAGVVIEADRGLAGREVAFRSSEYTTATDRPMLVVHYTDERPAVRSGWAESQPRSIGAGVTKKRITLWLDVDAAGATPTGAPTGFDQITLTHGGAFAVTDLDTFVVNGNPVPLNQVTWADNGASANFKCPRIQSLARVRVDFHIALSPALTLEQVPTPIPDPDPGPGPEPPTSNAIELQITVDDTATPGAWAQALWPGNADGTSGNGDDWILTIGSQTPVKIHLGPDTATVVERLCTQFTVTGEDELGNQSPVSADSFRVVPAEAGTISASGRFCAQVAGTARVIAYVGALSDTAAVVVTPALTPVFSSVALETGAGLATNALSPADTMLLDVTLSDGDGFQDVRRLDFDLSSADHEDDTGAPAFRASFRWTRGAAPSWALVDPTGTSWSVVPALCSVDSVTNSTAAQTVRLAFVVGRIARASNAGAWSATVRAFSATPPDTTRFTHLGLDCLPRLEITAADSSGAFNPGQVGALQLPLAAPTDGHLDLTVVANTSWNLRAAADDLVGLFSPLDTMLVRAPNQRIAWALNAAGTGGGTLDTEAGAIATGQPAPTTEDPIGRALYLWVNHPASIVAQDYRGDLRVQVAAPALGATTPEVRVPLTASVVSGGLAAQSMLAEVVPHTVQAGAAGQAFDLYLLPQFQGTDTGINRILVDLPDGYGVPSVSAVEVSGSPVAFTDQSTPGTAAVILGTRVTSALLLHVRVLADAPTVLDPVGSSFVVLYDDTATALPPQAATEGNANGVSDGNSWTVQVLPGALASLVVAPDSVTCYLGNVVGFAAAGFDAYGNLVTPAVTWSVLGGIGTVGATTGTFAALAAGAGRVIGQSGGVADSAVVTVWPARAIAVRSVRGPASVYQGQPAAPLTVRIENLGGVSVVLDTVRLSFSRGSLGDADSEFVVTSSASNPDTLPVSAAVTLSYSIGVRSNALLAPLAVNARASGLEVGEGVRLTDAAADTALALAVLPGGFELRGIQNAGIARPGQKAVHLLTLGVRNIYPQERSLSGLVLANRTSGPGSQEVRDAELGDVSLYLDDGDAVFEAKEDTLLLGTTALDGALHFTKLDVPVAAGTERLLMIALDVPLNVRDGDALDLAVESPADVTFAPASHLDGAWPVDPSGAWTLDGMVADQIATTPAGPATLNPGAVDQLAFQLRLPANGYLPDVLQRVSVFNAGSAAPFTDIARVRAWADDGSAAFETGTDRLLGTLFHTGDRWQLTGLSEPVPLAGLLVFFTVDMTPVATEGRTVRLALPAGPDPGLGMQSGDSGPLDRVLESPQVQTVSTVDRVTLTARPITPGATRPGDRGRPILQLIATNSYGSDRTLSALTLANLTSGPGTQAERDGEIRVLTLHADGDGDGVLGNPAVDSVLATGFFTAGRATFTGLSWSVPAGTSRHLFATADVSPSGAADGDVLGSRLDDPASVTFVEPTAVTAVWPLESGARWTVDGLTAAQLVANVVPALTLGPGDGPALALDLVAPPNGYAPDLLRSLFVTNLGTATASDLGAVELWRDGGDGVFSAGGGDDLSLGPLTPLGGGWQSPLLGAGVSAPGTRLFVSVTIGAAPAESSTVRLALPVNGLQNESGNDGPLDAMVANPDALLLSDAPLRATVEVQAASTLDQTIEVRMLVRNAGDETVDGIAASPIEISGPAAFTLVSGPAPASLDLAPGEADTLRWQYRAIAVGETRFSGSAAGTGSPSGLPRRAPAASSGLHRVFQAASQLSLAPVQTMPASVNAGEADVVPFSLTLTNPGGPGVSDVHLRRLKITLETGSGQPIVPADLLTRVVVNEGTNTYLVKTAIETAGNEVDLPLATPVLITGSEPTTLNLRLDVAATTTAPSFRVVIADSTRFTAEDVTSLAPVTVQVASGSYPVRSNLARIVAVATDLNVVGLPADSARVSRGSIDVPMLDLRLENPGIIGVTSDVRVDSLALVLFDDADAPIVRPADRVKRIRVLDGTRLLANVPVGPGDGPALTLPLSPPLNLPANSPVDLTFRGDIADSAALESFRAVVLDSSRVSAYDAITRAAVGVHLSPDSIRGTRVVVESDADTLVAGHLPALPPVVVIGETDVTALLATLRHPGGPGAARLRVDSLHVTCRDDQRRPLFAATYLDRLRVLWNGIEVATVLGLPAANGVTVALPGPLLEPGDTARVALVLDVAATAPAGSLELVLAAGGISAVDANRGSATTLAPESGSELPMLSGIARVVSPSRELVVGLRSRMPTVLAGDGRPVPAATLSLGNRDPQGTGSISVDWLQVLAAGADFAPIPVGGVAERLEAWVGGVKWAETAALTPDSTSASLIGSQRLELLKDQTVEVELRWVPRPGAGPGRVRMGCDRAGIGVVQPSSALLAIQVLAESGQSFPLWTADGGFSAADLAASYANFPNPFAAGRQATTFAYYLRGPARVSLRILSPRGQGVATLLGESARPAGLHQNDVWDGRNGRGDAVANGVYVAELTVRYDDGSSERLLRRVAVVR